MSPDVEYAMNIVQLTGVLIPLLLGITRYYINEENSPVMSVSNTTITLYLGFLFLSLLVAYYHAYTIIVAHQNDSLTTSVFTYGAFLTLLFAAIPYMLDQKWLARLFGGGGLLILGISIILTGVSMIT